MGSMKGVNAFEVLPPISTVREDVDMNSHSTGLKSNSMDIYSNSMDKHSNYLTSETGLSARKDVNSNMKVEDQGNHGHGGLKTGPFSSILENRNTGSDDER